MPINNPETEFAEEILSSERKIEQDPILNGLYTMVSANLSNFLPGINPSTHLKVFEKILTYKNLSKREQSKPDNENQMSLANTPKDIWEYLRKKPAIICTFHLGSYRLINSLLLKNGIPFTLAIGADVLEQEGKDYLNDFKTMFPDCQITDFRLLNAEHPTSGLKMLKELKRGRVLVLYIDGNSGAGTCTTQNENSCLIDFLAQRMYARTGVATLAYLTQVPIFPVISYDSGKSSVIEFDVPIQPPYQGDRRELVTKITQRIFDFAAARIRFYPDQWEGWLYLQKVAKVVPPTSVICEKQETNLTKFNLRQYGLFQIEQQSFLFQKRSYTSFIIDNRLFDLLREATRAPVQKDRFKMDEYQELQKNGVLY